jgi:hypothetical protein
MSARRQSLEELGRFRKQQFVLHGKNEFKEIGVEWRSRRAARLPCAGMGLRRRCACSS